MENLVVLPRDSSGGPKAKRKRSDGSAAVETAIKRPRLASDLSIVSADDSKVLESVEARFQVQIHSVISSSKIQKKVTSVLRNLSASGSSTEERPRVSVLRAKAPDAGKLVTIAEIAKREIAASKEQDGGGRWFQYIGLGEEIKESPEEADQRITVEDTILGGEARNEAGDGDRDEKAANRGNSVGVTKSPFERAIEGRPKKQAVAVMNLFLSRVSIEELKKRYGEQTNEQSTGEKT